VGDNPERKLLIEDDAFNFSNDLMIALVRRKLRGRWPLTP